MTENKYYTPSIEEFHVGFEFEWDKNGNGDFKIMIFDKNWYLDRFYEELINEKIRVKHLDKEDIEECGWKKSAEQKELYSINWIENADEKKNCIWMAKVNENKYQITDCRHTWHFVLFAGTIKNKSELKRIMKMICIDLKD